jgi:site-specific recombinase XerC
VRTTGRISCGAQKLPSSYKTTGNLRAVQTLLGCTKIASTVH